MDEDQKQRPDSLLPYEEWTEEALRHVVVRALRHAAVQGLPGDHHFYLTFRTDHPGTVLPARLRAQEQYRQEMTIVLQHQFWDLSVDEGTGMVGVGLSFGGVPAMLGIPLAAVTAFADPHVGYGLRFQPPAVPEPAAEPETAGAAPGTEEATAGGEADGAAEPPQVVSLDAFRRRNPARE